MLITQGVGGMASLCPEFSTVSSIYWMLKWVAKGTLTWEHKWQGGEWEWKAEAKQGGPKRGDKDSQLFSSPKQCPSYSGCDKPSWWSDSPAVVSIQVINFTFSFQPLLQTFSAYLKRTVTLEDTLCPQKFISRSSV